MLSITILIFHNLDNFLAIELVLSAGYFVAADAAGAVDGFAAVGANAFAVVDGFAAVVAVRHGCSGFFLQEFSPLLKSSCGRSRIKVSETTSHGA